VPDTSAAPAFADVTRGPLRLLLSGPTSSGARALTDGAQPVPGGWNRIHLIIDNLDTEIDRLRTAGLAFRNDAVSHDGAELTPCAEGPVSTPGGWSEARPL
jgi:hypothetical protein